MGTILIGIAGGTGSGKTTLTAHLKRHFTDDISVVHHDSYYKRQDRPFEERCKGENFRERKVDAAKKRKYYVNIILLGDIPFGKRRPA